MEPEFDRMQRANAALEAWVRDLLSENQELRRRLTLSPRDDEDRQDRLVMTAAAAPAIGA